MSALSWPASRLYNKNGNLTMARRRHNAQHVPSLGTSLRIHRYEYVTTAGATPPLPPQPAERWQGSRETLADGRVRYTWEYLGPGKPGA